MKKLLSTLTIGAFSITALISTAPAFAHGVETETHNVQGGRNENRTVQIQPVLNSSVHLENEIEHLGATTSVSGTVHVENEIEHGMEVRHNNNSTSTASTTSHEGRGRGRGRGRGEHGVNASSTTNTVIRLPEIEKEFHVVIPSTTSATTTAALQSAIQKARMDFLAAIEAARLAFKNALQTALNQFQGTTTTVSASSTISTP